MKKPSPGDLVGLLWYDADQVSGWSEPRPGAVGMWSYGLWVGKNRYFAQIADTFNDVGSYGGLNNIPWRSIVKIKIFARNPPKHQKL